MVIKMAKVRLLSHTPDPQLVVAAAARMCYAPEEAGIFIDRFSEDAEQTERYIRMLTELGHESVFEHVTFTFIIEDVSRSLLAQLTRHRIASYSVRSQRYVSEDAFEYITPPEIAAIPEAKKLFEEAMESSRESYQKLSELLSEGYVQSQGVDPKDKKAMDTIRKQAAEDARFVLPNACATQLLMTINVRSLYNFFALRCCNRAQWEIRTLADQMLELVAEVAPLLFSHAGPPCLRGGCPEGKMSCGKMAAVRQQYSRFSHPEVK